MGIFDKIKDFAEQNPEKADQVIDKAGDMIDAKTDGKYADKVDQAQELAKEKLHGGQAAQPEEAPAEENL